MPSGALVRPEMTEDTRLAQARERFLTGEPIEPGRVRGTILASWRRSREWNVAADHIGLSWVGDPDLDTPLTRTALPVLRNLRENLQGQPISVMLTDARGVLLSRLTADHDLERYLDGVQLVPGFSYAEEFAGTKGIGTALESGQAAHVFGHEHYAEHLEDLACAAAPVRHPLSGKIIGVVDLTCWREDAGELLIALAQSTAGQITQALLSDTSAGGSAAAGVPAGLPARWRDRLRAQRRHHDDEPPRPGCARPRRPGRDARACSRGAGRRPSWSGGCRAALRRQGPAVLPARSRAEPAAARRRRRAREADRGGQQAGTRGGAAAAQVRAWPGRLRSVVATRVRSGGCGLLRGRLARGAERAREPAR
jgi:hypothetical protein